MREDGAVDSSKLLSRMRRTKSNRFNFAYRLNKKAQFKSHIINLSSLICIVVSIYFLAYAGQVSGDSATLFGVVVAAVSVWSLILSLQDPVSDLARRAGDAHRCAREISNLYGRLQSDIITVQEAREGYERILDGYQNHEDVDNWKTLYDRSSEYPGDSKNIGWYKGCLCYFVSCYSTPIFAIFIIVFCSLIWTLLKIDFGQAGSISCATVF